MAQTPACYNHPAIAATATCADCGAGICADCTCNLRGQPFCPADYAIMRREPADAHLPVEVPPYQPPQYRYQLPTLGVESSLIIDTLMPSSPKVPGSDPATRALNRIPQPRRRIDVITKWAWVGFGCTALTVLDVLSLSMLFSISYTVGQIAAYTIPILAGIGLIINIVTVVLRRRSVHSNTLGSLGLVGSLGCFSLCANGLILAATAYIIWMINN